MIVVRIQTGLRRDFYQLSTPWIGISPAVRMTTLTFVNLWDFCNNQGGQLPKWYILLTFFHLYPCNRLDDFEAHQGSYNNKGGQLSKQVILARARDCQTRKSRAALNSFRVLRPPYWSLLLCLLPSCLQRERSLVLMLANAEDVLARSMFL